jgi:4-carboxymuconolactone decarboxylase
MSLLPYLRREELDEPGLALWNMITSSRGAEVVNDEGALVGPFNAWMHAPNVGVRLTELGAVLRFEISLDRRLLELAIITVGAHWKAEFEWWAHTRLARKHGVPDAALEAIGRGEAPILDREDERAVYSVARQLVDGGRIDRSTYSEAQRLLGNRGMVELVSLCGYYTLVSFTLNAFEVPLPAGIAPTWND